MKKIFQTLICSFLLFSLPGNAQETNKPALAEAYFAGGCFWCMEPPFEKLPGVKEVISGYAGGSEKNPSYKDVAGGQTRHREAVKVIYDQNKISFAKLVEVFWKQVNPTDSGGQFVDRGFQYSTAIWFLNSSEKKVAEDSKMRLDGSRMYGKEIVTPILPFTTFYPAEDYHQDYYKRNPIRYKYYRFNSGRDRFLKRIWKK